MSTPSFVIGGGIILGSGICPSTPRDAPGQFTCDLNTIPGGSAAVISFTVTADRGGSFTNEAQVTTSSVDPDPLNNRDEESVTVVQVVPIDIKPGDPTNPVKVSPRGGGGRIPVAILSTREFEAPARIDVASLTFGRTGDEPSLSSCRSERADGDQLLDLLCLFDNDPRLFQEGDSAGILRGRTFDSVPILIEGRDAVRPVP